jgi:hypothetical protein
MCTKIGIANLKMAYSGTVNGSFSEHIFTV